MIYYDGGILEPVVSASLREELNGEYTLDFDVPMTSDMKSIITIDSSFTCYGQTFDVGHLKRSISQDGSYTMQVECDHISYRLNRKEYDMEGWEDPEVEEGVDPPTPPDNPFRPITESSPSYILNRILAGTPFTGTTDIGGSYDFSISGVNNRRQMLQSFIELVRGEVTYDQMTIKVNKKRGIDSNKIIETGVNVLMLDEEIDKRTRREGTDDEDKPFVLSYSCQIIENIYDDSRPKYELGDTVLIIDPYLDINTRQRVISISRNPLDAGSGYQLSLGDLSKRKIEDVIKDMVGDAIGDYDGGGDGSGEQGPRGPEGPPGPQGPPGPPGEDAEPSTETRSRIETAGGGVYVEASSNGILFNTGATNGSALLQLNDSVNGQPLLRDGPALRFKDLERIAFSGRDSATGQDKEMSSITCQDQYIRFIQDATEYLLDLSDGGNLQALTNQRIDSKNYLKFSDVTKLRFSETNVNTGETNDKSSIECTADNIQMSVNNEIYRMSLAGGSNGKALMGFKDGSDNVLDFEYINKISFVEVSQEGGSSTATEKSSVECDTDVIYLKVGSDTYALDLANGRDGYQLTKEGQKIVFKFGGGIQATANVVIADALPEAGEASLNTLYLIYQR